jgi:hypothetical protein
MNPHALQGLLEPAVIAAMKHAHALRAEAVQQALRNLFRFRPSDDGLARRESSECDDAASPDTGRVVP